jgi:hypothetical protein
MSEYKVPAVSGVSAEVKDGDFLVTWETDGPPPSSGKGTFLLSLFVQAPGAALRQFGVKFIDSETPIVFVFDHGASNQKTMNSADVRVGEEVRQLVVFFPREWTHDMRGSADGYGVTSIDGHDLDQQFAVTIEFP